MTRNLNDMTEKSQLTNDSGRQHVNTDMNGCMNKWTDIDEANFAPAPTSLTLKCQYTNDINNKSDRATHK